jgi:hypothetical protein
MKSSWLCQQKILCACMLMANRIREGTVVNREIDFVKENCTFLFYFLHSFVTTRRRKMEKANTNIIAH